MGRELVPLLGWRLERATHVFFPWHGPPVVSFINKGSRQGRSCLYLSGSPDPDEIHQSPHATLFICTVDPDVPMKPTPVM